MRVDAKNFPVLKAALDAVWLANGPDACPPAYALEGFTVAELVTAEGALDELNESELSAFCTGPEAVQVAFAARGPELALADRVLTGSSA